MVHYVHGSVQSLCLYCCNKTPADVFVCDVCQNRWNWLGEHGTELNISTTILKVRMTHILNCDPCLETYNKDAKNIVTHENSGQYFCIECAIDKQYARVPHTRKDEYPYNVPCRQTRESLERLIAKYRRRLESAKKQEQYYEQQRLFPIAFHARIRVCFADEAVQDLERIATLLAEGK